METSYIDSVNRTAAEAVMHLYGSIGEKVDGDLFARELASLDSNCDLDLIKIRINSPGGNVFQGMSIVSAILAADTPIHVYVDGIAASMAAVVAVCADKVFMQDFAKLMIHDPAFAGEIKLTDKYRKMLGKIRDMLQGVLSRRGNNPEEIAELMAAETWFSASEAKRSRLCDEILTSGRSGMEALVPDQIFDRINNEYKSQKQTRMKLNKKTADLLGVSAEIDEQALADSVVAYAEAKEKEIEQANTELSAVKKRAEEAEAKLAQIEAAAAARRKEEAAALLEAAQKDGRIDATNAEALASWGKMFEVDHEAAKASLAAIPVRRTLASRIGGPAADDALLGSTWDELDRTGRLAELKERFPDAYDEKFRAKFKKSSNLITTI